MCPKSCCRKRLNRFGFGKLPDTDIAKLVKNCNPGCSPQIQWEKVEPLCEYRDSDHFCTDLEDKSRPRLQVNFRILIS